eukprot:COSAG01_NODE_57733_length_310_cov_1.009479_1_plen_38_part_01
MSAPKSKSKSTNMNRSVFTRIPRKLGMALSAPCTLAHD